jgi:Bacterial PH domain
VLESGSIWPTPWSQRIASVSAAGSAVMFFVLGLLDGVIVGVVAGPILAVLAVRMARVAVIAQPDTLKVRNVLGSHTVSWADIDHFELRKLTVGWGPVFLYGIGGTVVVARLRDPKSIGIDLYATHTGGLQLSGQEQRRSGGAVGAQATLEKLRTTYS